MNWARGAQNILMLGGDTGVFFTALYLALFIRNLAPPSIEVYQEHITAFFLLLIAYEIVLYIAGFWSQQVIPTTKNIFELLLPAHTLATVVMMGYFYFLPNVGMSPKTNLLLFSTLLFVGMFAWKLGGLRLFALQRMRAVLIGRADDIKEMFRTQPLWNIHIIENISPLSGTERISQALTDSHANTVLVDVDRYPRIDALYQMMFRDISIWDITSLREEVQSKIDLERIDHNWFIEHITTSDSTYRFFKRSIDLMSGLVLAALTLVVFPFIYIAMQIEDGGPTVISQKRVGVRGRPFTFYKFRSMHSNDDLWKSKHNEDKITRVGAWLRLTRIDEIVQCINLIRGDISLVGPRAILIREHDATVKKNPFQQARLLVQPGLTGWAQVNQPHAPATEEEALDRLAYDLYYIKNISLWLDVKIIFKTFKKLAQCAGMK